ncbi:MAG: Unknown protein, partial [uncultured Sulfurovum sp.]
MQTKLYFDTSSVKKEVRDNLFDAARKESETIGYYKLPDQDISEILNYVENFDENIEHIVVLGIGGSS